MFFKTDISFFLNLIEGKLKVGTNQSFRTFPSKGNILEFSIFINPRESDSYSIFLPLPMIQLKGIIISNVSQIF